MVIWPRTVPKLTYINGADDPDHQFRSTSVGAGRGSRNRRVSGNGEGSRLAGKRVTYGAPIRWATIPSR
jgi:hypothetical protein